MEPERSTLEECGEFDVTPEAAEDVLRWLIVVCVKALRSAAP